MGELKAPAMESWRASVVRDFAGSELFDHTFNEGMELVEETAAYLDGPGRHESKRLSRQAALAYASESMRLTTRLMQMASWLLVQRAVREGQMDPAEACADRYRLAADLFKTPASDQLDKLPTGLLGLLDRSGRLYERALHLDRRMYLEAPADEGAHPVLAQIDRLQAAFGGPLA
jgi:regulator of CtrA degradation